MSYGFLIAQWTGKSCDTKSMPTTKISESIKDIEKEYFRLNLGTSIKGNLWKITSQKDAVVLNKHFKTNVFEWDEETVWYFEPEDAGNIKGKHNILKCQNLIQRLEDAIYQLEEITI